MTKLLLEFKMNLLENFETSSSDVRTEERIVTLTFHLSLSVALLKVRFFNFSDLDLKRKPLRRSESDDMIPLKY